MPPSRAHGVSDRGGLGQGLRNSQDPIGSATVTTPTSPDLTEGQFLSSLLISNDHLGLVKNSQMTCPHHKPQADRVATLWSGSELWDGGREEERGELGAGLSHQIHPKMILIAACLALATDPPPPRWRVWPSTRSLEGLVPRCFRKRYGLGKNGTRELQRKILVTPLSTESAYL